MKGRKPTPLDLKILRGQRIRSRKAADPSLIVSSPEKPRGLGQLESACWNSLVRDLSQRRLLHESMRVVLRRGVCVRSDSVIPFTFHPLRIRRSTTQQQQDYQ